jgi:hypothetical protein
VGDLVLLYMSRDSVVCCHNKSPHLQLSDNHCYIDFDHVLGRQHGTDMGCIVEFEISVLSAVSAQSDYPTAPANIVLQVHCLNVKQPPIGGLISLPVSWG